jgi:hypothetical protein
MTTPPAVWANFIEQPLFALTSDQDWAPEWAAEIFLDEVRRCGVPLHIFRTSPSTAFDAALRAGEIEQGWHPNFRPGSSQGSTISEVIEYCESNFPGASTVRSHCFAEDTFAWRALRSAGVVADSQLCSLFQGYVLPIAHWTGIVRLPIYFEDDVFFEIAPGLDLETVLPTLFTPGLKILNFHPTFVGCNTPSRSFHESMKEQIFAPNSAPVQWTERGTCDIFRELIARIQSTGHKFHRFQSLVDLAVDNFQSADDLIPTNLKASLHGLQRRTSAP